MKKVKHNGFDLRRLIGALVMASLIAVPIGGYMYFDNRENVLSLKVGSQFPSSSLSTLSHTVIQTDSLITNKCLVVWISTQCPLCRDEIRSLDSVGKMVGDSLKIIVVSLNSHRETEFFKNNNHITLPIYMANREDAWKTYHINRLPTLFFIGEHKEIRSIVSTIALNKSMSPL